MITFFLQNRNSGPEAHLNFIRRRTSRRRDGYLPDAGNPGDSAGHSYPACQNMVCRGRQEQERPAITGIPTLPAMELSVHIFAFHCLLHGVVRHRLPFPSVRSTLISSGYYNKK